MKKVILRELSVFDLSVTYARPMGQNKIKHYKVSMALTLVSEKPALQFVKEFIEREEGPCEFEVIDAPRKRSDNSLPLELSQVPLLENYPEIEQALLKNKSMSQIYQTAEEIPLTPEQIKANRIAKPYNKFIRFVNRVIHRIQYVLFGVGPARKKYEQKGGFFIDQETQENTNAMLEYSAKLAKIFQFKEKTEYVVHYNRYVHPATYLSVAFEEGKERLAAATLVADLKKCYDKGLILGHFVMPSLIILADTVGSGKRQFALFCFPILDHKKIVDQYKVTDIVNAPRPLDKLLELETHSFEGGINYLQPMPSYDIEVVDMNQSTRESNLEEVIKAYQESVPVVNSIAKKMKSDLTKKPRNG